MRKEAEDWELKSKMERRLSHFKRRLTRDQVVSFAVTK